MSIANSIVQVLAEANEPLHYREVCKRCMEQQLYVTTASKPEATIAAHLAATKFKSLFVAHGKGVYSLREGAEALAPSSQRKQTKAQGEPRTNLATLLVSTFGKLFVCFQNEPGRHICIAEVTAEEPNKALRWFGWNTTNKQLTPQRVSDGTAEYAFEYEQRLTQRGVPHDLKAMLDAV